MAMIVNRVASSARASRSRPPTFLSAMFESYSASDLYLLSQDGSDTSHPGCRQFHDEDRVFEVVAFDPHAATIIRDAIPKETEAFSLNGDTTHSLR